MIAAAPTIISELVLLLYETYIYSTLPTALYIKHIAFST